MLENLPPAIGEALKSMRPGLERVIALGSDFASVPDLIEVTSPAFRDGEPLPERFTDDGEGTSPPIAWSGVPEGTGSVVLVIEDADSPTPHPLVHAIVFDLPGRDGELPEGALPSEGAADSDPPAMGRNSFLSGEYLPPDPPPGHGPHRYVVQAFALDTAPEFEGAPGRGAILDALRGHVLAKGILIGTYERE